MRRAFLLTLLAATLSAQTFAPAGTLKFEAVSIKKSQSGEKPHGTQPESGGRRYIGAVIPLRSYLYVAYQVRPDQIVGGPAWLDSDNWDLNAEAEKPSSIEDLHIMLQNALTERFKLRFHHAAKEMAAYVLAIDKDGPKNLTLRPAVPGADFHLDQQTEQIVRMKWSARCASLDFFTWRLSPWLERPVLNQTGLKGCFDFDLAFTGDLPAGVQDGQLVNGVPLDASGPTIFQALPAQLGLKLESKKAPVDTLVVDSADRSAVE